MSNWLNMNPADSKDICIEIEDLIDGFAIGALEPEEMLFVANAIDDCPELAVRLNQLDETVGLLGLSVPAIDPAPELWNRVNASTRMTTASADPIDIASRRKPGMLTVPKWAATLVSAAAVVLLISSVALGMALRGDDSSDPTDNFESAMTTYMTSGGTMLQLSSQAAPEYQTWPGKGTLLTAPDMAPVVFVDKCMPSSDDFEYVVWLQKGDVRTPMGKMEISEDGQGMLSLEGVESLAEYDAIGISIKTREDEVYDLMEGWPKQEG